MIKQLLTILILLVFTHSTFASNDVNTELCKDKIAVLLDKDKRDQFSKELEDLGFTEKVDRVVNRYGECIQSPLQDDISIEILGFLFGEAIYDSIATIVSITNGLLGLNGEFDANEFKEKIENGFGNNYFLHILASINTFLFYCAIPVTIYFSSGFMFKIMNGKKMPEAKYLFKSLSKGAIGYSLIAPVPAFAGLSLVQFIFLFLISLGVFIVKFLYTLIVFGIALINFEINVEEEFQKAGLESVFIERVENNVHMHMCDIQSRELILEGRGYLFNSKYSLLAQDSYYKCLTDPLSLQKAQSFYFIKSYTPDDIQVGEYCAKTHGEVKMREDYCGNLYTTNDKEKSIADSLGIHSQPYQSMLRSIALKLREVQCKNDTDGFVYDTGTYNCIQQNLNGEYVYDKEKDRILYISLGYQDENARRKDIQDLSDTEYDKLETYFAPKLREVFTKLLFENKEEELEKEVGNMINLINHGWFMTGSVYFEKNKFINDISKEIALISSSYNIAYDTDKKDRLTNQEGSDKRKAIDSVSSIFKRPKPLEQSTSLFDIKKLINSQFDLDGGCSEDLSKCEISIMNSYLALSQAGNNILYKSLGISFSLKLVNKTIMSMTSYIPESMAKPIYSVSNLIEIVGNIFQGIVIVGFILGVVFPFIPFFYFASKIVAWIISVIKTVIVIPLVSVYFLVPTEGEEFEGQEYAVYKLALSTILMPILILTSFVVSFFYANVFISLFNILFSLLINFLDLTFGWGSIWQVFQGFLGMVIYVVCVAYIIVKCCEIIKTMPRLISKLLDIEVEENQIFAGMKQHIENSVIPMLTKSKLFTI
jgi:hypothetical protein